jgi:hypothetical protein
MEEKSNIFIKANNLMKNALQEKSKGEYEWALDSMNEAIELLENMNLDTFQFKIQRELLHLDATQTKDYSRLINLYEDALEAIMTRQNLVEQIDTLIPLAGICIHAKNKSKAHQYLEQAEKILTNVAPGALQKYLSKNSTMTGELYLQYRSDEISRMREALHML